MTRYNKYILLPLFAVLTFSCTDISSPPLPVLPPSPLPPTTPDPEPEPLDFSMFYQFWVHSFEEETDSVQIYRPRDYKEFPPAWYRFQYEFHEDGTCQYLVLGPADGHYLETGKWIMVPEDNRTLLILDRQNRVIRKIRIVKLEKDKLLVVN